MKLRIFISSVLLVVIGLESSGCGPYNSLTKNPLKFHFYQEETIGNLSRSYNDENVKLWKKLSDPELPDEEIEDAVYNSSLRDLKSSFEGGSTQNRFLLWIIRNEEKDIEEFLLTAKELEELRIERASAWYHPSSKSKEKEDVRFHTILSKCKEHLSGRLADRYLLQAIRALMSLGEYQEAIGIYKKKFQSYPENNLFKRMSKRYVAGCLQRIGNIEESNRMFAEVGDFNSMVGDKENDYCYMAYVSPESPELKIRLNRVIGYGDSVVNNRYYAVAEAALKSPHVVNRGDWLFLKAYVEGIYNHNSRRAVHLVKQALKSKFSTEEMRNDAKFFKICIDAENGNLSNLQENVGWILNTYGNRDGLWFYIIPALLKKGRTTEALLLANCRSGNDEAFADTGFQMMLSCKAKDIVAYKKYLDTNNSEFFKSFRNWVISDKNYLNEIIGTLFLREGDYENAAKYLADVSLTYQKLLSIYTEEFLIYDPWQYTYTDEDKWYYRWWRDEEEIQNDDEEGEVYRPIFEKAKNKRRSTQDNAKLKFAREMARLSKVIKTGKTKDERMLAKLKYTIGRYNSFNSCWALTQYWLGNTYHRNYQLFYYGWDDVYELDYIIDLPRELAQVSSTFKEDVEIVFKELQSNEAKAEAHLMLRNFKTIARHYPKSAAGKYLSAHCDGWKDWL